MENIEKTTSTSAPWTSEYSGRTFTLQVMYCALIAARDNTNLAGSESEITPQKRPEAFRSGPSIVYLLKPYSAGVPSTSLVVATVQFGSPTLKRAKRRTVMFSPSLPTFCAISSLIEIDCSLMKGCYNRQTSS